MCMCVHAGTRMCLRVYRGHRVRVRTHTVPWVYLCVRTGVREGGSVHACAHAGTRVCLCVYRGYRVRSQVVKEVRMQGYVCVCVRGGGTGALAGGGAAVGASMRCHCVCLCAGSRGAPATTALATRHVPSPQPPGCHGFLPGSDPGRLRVAELWGCHGGCPLPVWGHQLLHKGRPTIVGTSSQ